MTFRLDDAQILAGIADVARRELSFAGELERETSLVDALKLDSLRLLTLVVELENHFRVALEEGSETGISTVGDLVDAIRSGLESDSSNTQ